MKKSTPVKSKPVKIKFHEN